MPNGYSPANATGGYLPYLILFRLTLHLYLSSLFPLHVYSRSIPKPCDNTCFV
jgi:hypothetical protein